MMKYSIRRWLGYGVSGFGESQRGAGFSIMGKSSAYRLLQFFSKDRKKAVLVEGKTAVNENRSKAVDNLQY